MDLAAWISIAGVSAGFMLLALTRLAPDLVLFGLLKVAAARFGRPHTQAEAQR